MTRRIFLPLVIIGAILLVILLGIAGALRPLQDGIRWALLPVTRIAASVGLNIGSQMDPPTDAATLQARLDDAEARLRAVSVDYVRLRALEEENTSLRKLAKFLEDSEYDHVSARIISRSSNPREAVVLIDHGAQDGLETGMAVVAEDGVFVGKITSLSEHVATVTLVSDERSRVAASIAGSRELDGMVQGQGNGVAQMTLIPQSVAVKRNDVIVTAGTEDKIPPNLAIGLVNDVEGKPTDPFKAASLQPMLDMTNLDLVAVLRPDALRPTQ